MYKVYETILPLVTSWYTIWAKVIVIVATYRRVITVRSQKTIFLVEVKEEEKSSEKIKVPPE